MLPVHKYFVSNFKFVILYNHKLITKFKDIKHKFYCSMITLKEINKTAVNNLNQFIFDL